MLRFVLAALAACLLLASTAVAADTHAPRGARLDWLPSSAWVMSSWAPFDETRLEAVLHTDRAALLTWLDDRRTLRELATEHGVAGSTRTLAHRLVAPRHVSRAQRRVLEARAAEMLTQAHLSRHVLFHVFHTPAIADAAPHVFGVSAARFRTLRATGRTPVQIGEAGHRSAEHVRGALWSLLRNRAARGVAAGALSRAQADRLLAEQREQLPWYVVRQFRTPEQQVAFLCRPH